MDTHNLILEFGKKHRGKLITRVPVGYLTWMCREADGYWKGVARAELDRRGTRIPDLEISNHAIDRASLRCRRMWVESAKNGEGLYSWLLRMCREALDVGELKEDIAYHNGMKLVFDMADPTWPVLKSVVPRKKVAKKEK